MSKNPFSFRNGQAAHTYHELLELCQQYPEDALYHLSQKHFSAWIEYAQYPEHSFFRELFDRIESRVGRDKHVNYLLPAWEYSLMLVASYNRDHRDPFVFRNGQAAYTYAGLIDLCGQYPEDGLYHLCEGHFETWFEYTNYQDWKRYQAEAKAMR